MTLRAFLLALLFCLPAMAQDAYPSRPVQLISPFAPGSSTDLMARALQAEMSQALGQMAVGMNGAGAAGAIGNAELFRARPEGLTIGISVNNATTSQPLLQPTPYQADGFRCICMFHDNPQVVITGRGAPVTDIADLVVHARRGREPLVYGAYGAGSTRHILMAQRLRAAGVEGLMVSCTGLMATVAPGGQIMAFVEAATISTSTGLAVLDPNRMAILPEVPSIAKAGHPTRGSTHGGLLAPAGLAATWERACETAVASKGFRAAAERPNAAPAFLPDVACRAGFLAEAAVNRALLREFGLSN